jgi:hypothetical protein
MAALQHRLAQRFGDCVATLSRQNRRYDYHLDEDSPSAQ